MSDKAVWVDSHCHLEMIKQSTPEVMEKSQNAGMAYCITIGTSDKANEKVKQLCQDHDNVFGTLGFHPHGASEVVPEQVEKIRNALQSNPRLVAVGECGYDLYYTYSAEKDQKKVFETQLVLALELDLPVVIHSRDADKQTRDMLDAFRTRGLTGVVHCFTSDLDQARYMLDYGLFLSFNGICTFPQAQPVRDVLQYTPLDRVLLETDSPYLSPVPFRGKPNIPGRVSIVGEYVADFLGIPASELAAQMKINTKTCFPRIDYEC